MTTDDPKRIARDFRDLAARFRNAAGDEARTQETTAIKIEVVRHPLYGGRWRLRCPRCGTRRGKLYVAQGGPACRCCVRLGYARSRR